MVTQEHGILAGEFVTELKLYLRKNPIGPAAVEARHHPITDDLNDRQPDVSFVSDLTKSIVRKGAVLFMPDVAIEIKSSSDSFKLMRQSPLLHRQRH